MTDAFIAFCTCPDMEVGHSLAKTLVTEQWAACVNILPGIQSVYVWDGSLCTDDEVLLIIKTTNHKWSGLQERVKTLHPYECPELIRLPIEDGLPDYLAWLQAQTSSNATTV